MTPMFIRMLGDLLGKEHKAQAMEMITIASDKAVEAENKLNQILSNQMVIMQAQELILSNQKRPIVIEDEVNDVIEELNNQEDETIPELQQPDESVNPPLDEEDY